MKNIVVVVFILVLVLLGFFGYRKYINRTLQANQTNNLIFTVQKGDIESTVTAIGSILSTDTRDIEALPGSTVKRINCTENQPVKKGDVLFTLTNESADLDLERAKLTLSQQQTQLITLLNQQKDLVLRAPVNGIIRAVNASINDSITPPMGIPGASPLIQLEDTSVMKFTIYQTAGDAGKNKMGAMPSTQKISVNFQGVGIRQCSVMSANVSPQGSSVTFQVLDPSGLTWDNFYTISIPVMMNVEIPITTPVQVVGNIVNINCKLVATVSTIKVAVGDIVKASQELIVTTSDTLMNQIQLVQLNSKAAQLDVNHKQKNIDDLTVRAPIDGVVYHILVKEGALVGSSSSQDSSGSTSLPQGLSALGKNQGSGGSTSISSSSLTSSYALSGGIPIATIENQTSRKVSISIDELDIGKIKLNQKAKDTLDAFNGKVFMGHISSISARGIIQNGTATFQADIQIDSSENLMTGMSANVSILTEFKKNVLVLPIDAVQSKNERRYVFIQSVKGIIEKDIQVGIVNEDYAEIISGLLEGDDVLVIAQDKTNIPRFPMMQGGMQDKHPLSGSQP